MTDKQYRVLRCVAAGEFQLELPGSFVALTDDDARFLLRVLPEALGIPILDLYQRTEALAERVLAREEAAHKLDAAIVEAAERYIAAETEAKRLEALASGGPRLVAIRSAEDATRALDRAVEAKRAALNAGSKP